MADIRHQIFNRLTVTLALLGVLPLLILGQMVRLVWFRGDELRARGEEQANSLEVIPAMRGAILDREGRTLAANEARYDLYVDATTSIQLQKNQKNLSFENERIRFVRYLSALTGRPEAHYALLLRSAPNKRNILISQKLTEEQKRKIEWWGVPGLIFRQTMSRRYNNGVLASNVLGFVVNSEGQTGIERQYNHILGGEDGKRPLQKSRPILLPNGTYTVRQQAISEGPVTEPRHGESVVLTLDLGWQTILEDELLKGVQNVGATWGTAIAVDPKTGGILAMANVPTFDPNLPSKVINPAWDPNKAQTNHAVQSQIEPGSTFKLVPALAALEMNRVSYRDSFMTGGGRWNFHGNIVRDDHPRGKLSFADVLVHSSNIGIGQVAERLKDHEFYQFLRLMGFGQTTLVDLPGEAGGGFRRPGKWNRITKNSMSRGYNIDVSPLQMAMAYAALANDCKLMRPFVVQERRAPDGHLLWKSSPQMVRQFCKPEIAQSLRENVFERAVELPSGTGNPAYVQGLRIGGKTGTARKTVNRVYTDGLYRASFAGFFPADKPEVVIVIVLDEPKTNIYGGETAAPIFKNMAERLIPLLPNVGQRLSPARNVPKRVDAPVPNVLGVPETVAITRLIASGFKASPSTTPWSTVLGQQPKAGSIQKLGTVVTLEVNKEAPKPLKEMPDVRGMDARQAMNWLTARGIKVVLKGGGRIIRQSPEPGAATPQAAVLFGYE
ncbi:MAG TPA: penicillin-binding transpeptidase domain-containing protein [Rhodothermales bacterium]|nr:penicillin-binding transpeptidase domain-containing protein [Rhodothermales bacterium]